MGSGRKIREARGGARGGGGTGGGGVSRSGGQGECVLWLVSDSEESNRNLLRQAEERGIESNRVVLAERRDFEQHIRRASAADLVADRSTYFYY